MAQESRNKPRYDKNIRSLLDAVAMLEREAAMIFERLGIDGETLRRALGVVGMVSGDLARQAAQAVGVADARAMDSLSRDVRALLEQVAHLRKHDVESATRLDTLEAVVSRLEGATSTLARLQGRTQAVLGRIDERAEAFEQVLELRTRQLDAVDGLRSRIEQIEAAVSETAVALQTRTTPALSAVRRGLRSVEPLGLEAGAAPAAAAREPEQIAARSEHPGQTEPSAAKPAAR